MEPRIQYAKTSDGVNIAYWTLGEGMPLLQMPNLPFSDMHHEWGVPEMRRWYQRIAKKMRHIRYDSRGNGLSERDVDEYSLDALVLDLETVVQNLGLERPALLAGFLAGPAAIAFAARHPEAISHLMLVNSFARGADVLGESQAQGLLALLDKDWTLFTETIAHAIFGWSAGEPAHRHAAFMRESVTQEAARAMLRVVGDVDVTALLPQVKAPTLVIHRSQFGLPDLSVSRGLASHIPNASIVVAEGGAWDLGEGTSFAAIDEFLGGGEGEEAATTVGPSEAGAFRTVLFTDLVGHTEMMQRLGDGRGREVLREHERITREALTEYSGDEIKTMGDGFMASFSRVTKAVECAIALQWAFAERESDEPLSVRVGINAGEPIEEDGDLFGATVILASRIAAKAEGGEILVADTIRGLCSGKGFLFADRGEFVAKGFEDPVRVYEVRWSEE